MVAVITESTDALAPLDPKKSVGTVMTNLMLYCLKFPTDECLQGYVTPKSVCHGIIIYMARHQPIRA